MRGCVCVCMRVCGRTTACNEGSILLTSASTLHQCIEERLWTMIYVWTAIELINYCAFRDDLHTLYCALPPLHWLYFGLLFFLEISF